MVRQHETLDYGERRMNGLQRVKAAITFDGPDRVPVYKASLGDVLPMPMIPSAGWRPGHASHEKGLFPFHQDDLVIRLGLWRWHKPDWAKAPEYARWLHLPREEVDEFGVIWNREGRNESLGHPGRPVLPEWSDFETYLSRYSPDASDRSRYSLFTRIGALAGRNRYRLCLLGYQGPVTMAHAVRGFSSLLTDHRKHPDELRRLLAHLTSYYIDSARSWVRYGGRPHGFMLYDDLGSEQGPFMSPDMFSDFYEPVFEPIIRTSHELGCEFHLHSCGKIDPLMPLLMEWGLDAFEFDSPRTIGWDGLEPFRGRVMLWGCVDILRVYATGTPEECEEEVALMVRHMGTPRGGFGAYFYPQPYHINVPRQNIRAFRRGLGKYGVYSR